MAPTLLLWFLFWYPLWIAVIGLALTGAGYLTFRVVRACARRGLVVLALLWVAAWLLGAATAVVMMADDNGPDPAHNNPLARLIGWTTAAVAACAILASLHRFAWHEPRHGVDMSHRAR